MSNHTTEDRRVDEIFDKVEQAARRSTKTTGGTLDLLTAVLKSQARAAEERGSTHRGSRSENTETWAVIVYNDDWVTLRDAITAIQESTDVDAGKAYELACIIHRNGSSCVFQGTYEEALEVFDRFRETKLKAGMKQPRSEDERATISALLSA